MSDAELDATLDEYDGCVRDLAQLSTQGMSDIALATQADNARDRIVAAFAAARREVETVTRERDGWERCTKELGSVVLRAWELLRKWWQFSKLEERDEPFADALARAIAADAEHDAYALCEIRRLNADLATSRAALEDVRRVEEWLTDDRGATRNVATNGEGLFSAFDIDTQSEWVAEDLPSLGRALAQEAGDDTR